MQSGLPHTRLALARLLFFYLILFFAPECVVRPAAILYAQLGDTVGAKSRLYYALERFPTDVSVLSYCGMVEYAHTGLSDGIPKS
jgi:hypothetical protein